MRDNAESDGSPGSEPAAVEVLRFDETLLVRFPRPESRRHFFCMVADMRRVYSSEGLTDPWVVDLSALDNVPPPLAQALSAIRDDFLKNGQSFLLVGDAAEHMDAGYAGHSGMAGAPRTDDAVARFVVRESFAPPRRSPNQGTT